MIKNWLYHQRKYASVVFELLSQRCWFCYMRSNSKPCSVSPVIKIDPMTKVTTTTTSRQAKRQTSTATSLHPSQRITRHNVRSSKLSYHDVPEANWITTKHFPNVSLFFLLPLHVCSLPINSSGSRMESVRLWKWWRGSLSLSLGERAFMYACVSSFKCAFYSSSFDFWPFFPHSRLPFTADIKANTIQTEPTIVYNSITHTPPAPSYAPSPPLSQTVVGSLALFPIHM